MAENTNRDIHSPKAIASVPNENMLIISNNLEESRCDGYEGPLYFYDGRFSRFSFTIITKEKKPITANLPIKDFLDVEGRTDFIYQKHLEMSMMPKEENLSPAYTVILTAGKDMKGKTPAQFLLEDIEKNKTLLNNQYKWIKSNINQNPKYREANQRQLDAIMDAGKLLKEGKLDKNKASGASKLFTIYDSGIKILERRKREDGRVFVYSIKITWMLGSEKPVEIYMKNFHAFIKKNNIGLCTVQPGITDEISKSVRVSVEDWRYVVYIMKVNMRTFEDIRAPRLYKIATNADIEKRRGAKQQ